MATERSDGLYEKWKESTEKFDYFMLAVLGALCAYVSQTYRPEKLGINPGTVELLALLILVLGAVFGFRRIETVNLCTLINQKIMHIYEKRGMLVSVLQNGSGTNTATGVVYTPEMASEQIPKLTSKIKHLEPQLSKAQAKAQSYYHWRNGAIIVGFLILLSAKLLTAYVQAPLQ